LERNTPQHKVDAFRAQMNLEQRGEFDDFCRYNRNTTAIRQLLEDWGYKVSQSAVQNWYKYSFPVGQEAKRFNLLATEYNGVEIGDALQKLLIVNANLIDRFIITLESASTEDIRLEQLVTAIPSLSREVRACASELQQLKYVKDRKELEMAGAYRAIQELKLIFADSAFEQALDEAARSVMTRLEGE
jgi:hypothetical protein